MPMTKSYFFSLLNYGQSKNNSNDLSNTDLNSSLISNNSEPSDYIISNILNYSRSLYQCKVANKTLLFNLN